jgi:hypothetical protein
MFSNHKQSWIIIFIVLFGLLAADLPASKKGDLAGFGSENLPFQVGEELHYKISWGFIPAGTGSIEIPGLAGDESSFHIVTTARSNSFVDSFYKVRNRIETFLDVNNDCSLGYKKSQNEGGHNRDVDLVFDHENSEVTLIKNGKFKKTLKVPVMTHDPLSAIYCLRTVNDWEEEPVLNVTDGKKNYQVRIRIHGKESVETPLGYFDTIKVEPIIDDMEIIFDKKKDGKLYIWLTDDDKKIPVKMQSELAFGSIQVILSEAKTSPEG